MAQSKMVVDDILETKVIDVKFTLAAAGFNDKAELVRAVMALGGKFSPKMKVSKVMLMAGMDNNKKMKRFVRTMWGADVLIMDIEEPGEGDLTKGDYEFVTIVEEMEDSIQAAGAYALATGIAACYLAARTEQRKNKAAEGDARSQEFADGAEPEIREKFAVRDAASELNFDRRVDTRATRASPSQGELKNKNAVDAAKDLATIDHHLNKKHKPSRGYYGHDVSVEVKVGKK